MASSGQPLWSTNAWMPQGGVFVMTVSSHITEMDSACGYLEVQGGLMRLSRALQSMCPRLYPLLANQFVRHQQRYLLSVKGLAVSQQKPVLLLCTHVPACVPKSACALPAPSTPRPPPSKSPTRRIAYTTRLSDCPFNCNSHPYTTLRCSLGPRLER